MPADKATELAELDRRYFFHPFTSLAEHERQGPPAIMTRGEGVWLFDAAENRYLDGLAGLWCVNVGYGRKELADAMREQAETLSYCHTFTSLSSDKPAILAERLVAGAPVPMSKVFFGNSGSDANDTQVKLAWYYNNVRGKPEKKKIIARRRAYHGVTIMAGGLTGLPGVHAGFDLPLGFVRHVSPPHRLWEGHRTRRCCLCHQTHRRTRGTDRDRRRRYDCRDDSRAGHGSRRGHRAPRRLFRCRAGGTGKK